MRLLAGDGDRTAHVRLTVVAQVAAREHDPSPLGVPKAEQQAHDGGLPGAARADERDAASGREAEVDAVQRRMLLIRVAGMDALERDGEGPARRRRGDCGVDDARRAAGQLEDPPPRPERRRELASGGGQRLDGFEGGERKEAQHGDEHRVETPSGGRLHRHGEDAGQRRAGHRDAEAVGDATDERVAAGDPDEPAVRGADAPERSLFPAVGGDLGCGVQQLDELSGELPARTGLPPSGRADQPAGERGNGHARDDEAGGQDEGGAR